MKPTIKELNELRGYDTSKYYDTTGETKEKVIEYRKINNGQDKKVLAIIRNLDKPFTSWEIHSKYNSIHLDKYTVITDIRRSIHTLKHANYIEETGLKPVDIKKRRVLQYKLTEN